MQARQGRHHFGSVPSDFRWRAAWSPSARPGCDRERPGALHHSAGSSWLVRRVL